MSPWKYAGLGIFSFRYISRIAAARGHNPTAGRVTTAPVPGHDTYPDPAPANKKKYPDSQLIIRDYPDQTKLPRNKVLETKVPNLNITCLIFSMQK